MSCSRVLKRSGIEGGAAVAADGAALSLFYKALFYE